LALFLDLLEGLAAPDEGLPPPEEELLAPEEEPVRLVWLEDWAQAPPSFSALPVAFSELATLAPASLVAVCWSACEARLSAGWI
jgi:hypothetical protein